MTAAGWRCPRCGAEYAARPAGPCPTCGTSPADAEHIAALGAALAAAEARAAAAAAALQEVAALYPPGPGGEHDDPDDRTVPVPAGVLRRLARAARGAAPG